MKKRRHKRKQILTAICKTIAAAHFLGGMFWVMCLDSPEHFAMIFLSMIYSFAIAAAAGFLILVLESGAEDPDRIQATEKHDRIRRIYPEEIRKAA